MQTASDLPRRRTSSSVSLPEPAVHRQLRQPRAATRQFGNLAARRLAPWHFSNDSATTSCPHATLHLSQVVSSFQGPRRLGGSLVSFPPAPPGAFLDPLSCEPAARSVASSVAVFPAPASSPLRQPPLANDRRRRWHRLGVSLSCPRHRASSAALAHHPSRPRHRSRRPSAPQSSQAPHRTTASAASAPGACTRLAGSAPQHQQRRPARILKARTALAQRCRWRQHGDAHTINPSIPSS